MTSTLSDTKIHTTMTYESQHNLDNSGKADNFTIPNIDDSDCNADTYVNRVIESLNDNRDYFVLEKFALAGISEYPEKSTYYVSGLVSTAKLYPFGEMPKTLKDPEDFHVLIEIEIYR